MLPQLGGDGMESRLLWEFRQSNEGILALYVWISIETSNAYPPKLPSNAYFQEPILAPPILVPPPFLDAPFLDASFLDASPS